jgi:hypothetical protein
MSHDIVNRKVANPRWRASSKTLVPEDDYDEYVPTFMRDETELPPSRYRGWMQPNHSQNRIVSPVLKNDYGDLVGSNRPYELEDSLKPWR